MMATLFRNIMLASVVLLLGCGTSKAPALKKHNSGLTGFPSSIQLLEIPAPGNCLEDENSSCPSPLEEEFLPAIGGKGRDADKTEDVAKNQDLLSTALDFCKASQEYWNEGEQENAIGALDQAYALVLEANADGRPELVQQKEDLRFMISKRVLEIYASRNTAVTGSHKAIPMTFNEYVEKEIKLFQGVERKFFVESFERSGRYRTKILKSLKDAGLPEEISWLPLIESGFKVNALSRARALGLWQFIPSTGYKFGLSRDMWVDERLDPEESTSAAIAYLKELHQIFGDWTTVLAAYNCGEGTVLRVIRNQKINYLDNFWDLYERLPRETARYVPRFLAVLHILKDPGKYGFELDGVERPLPYETVTIEKQVRLKDVAKKLGVSSGALDRLNPELRRQVTPAEPYSLKVPPGAGETLIARIGSIPKYSPPKKKYAYHRVRKGETLSLIAMKYRTSINSIVRTNNIRRKHLIRVGQRLKIPLRGSVRSARSYSLSANGKYRVRKGDSLWRIAKRFGTSAKKLQQINNLRSARLSVGQMLRVK